MLRRSLLSLIASAITVAAFAAQETICGILKLSSPGKPALKLNTGALIPLSGDESTLGVFLDPRVRDLEFELTGRKTPQGVFLVDPIHTKAMYVNKDGQKLFVTYWCDICSIRTYTPGQCWCCQEDTQLDLRDRYDN